MSKTYSLVGSQMNSNNVAKVWEASHSAKPRIMTPRASLVPPAPRPGYSPVYLPTWCDVGQQCDAVLCATTQKQQGQYLPPRSRNPIAWDSNIAYMR